MDQPQSALVLDDELFASAREQWHQSNGQASTSGTSGDYYGLLGVSKVIQFVQAPSSYRTAREVYPLHGRSAYQGGQYAVWLGPGLLHMLMPVRCAGCISRGDQAGVLCAGQEAASGQEPGR